MNKHSNNQLFSFLYLSLGDSAYSQMTNLNLINMLYSMVQRQMEVQSVTSVSDLKGTEYLRIETCGDDIKNKRFIFKIHFRKCVNNPTNAKYTFSKLTRPLVSVNGESPLPFYVCLNHEYHPVIQLEVSEKVLSCWESWIIPFKAKTTSKYVIPLFLFLYNRMHQKVINVDFSTLKKKIGASGYSICSDFEKRCLKPMQKIISKAFNDGLCVLKFEYNTTKFFGKRDMQISFIITMRNIGDIKGINANKDEQIDVIKKEKNAVNKDVGPIVTQDRNYSKHDDKSSFQSMIENIRNYTLGAIMQLSWKDFESFVRNLMLKMNYNGVHAQKAFVTSSTRDHGIDGFAELDEYGQKKIYFQAKRWDNTKVSRPELQKFVGALQSYSNAVAGFFVTTSDFTNDALDYADGLSCSFKLILIDKNKLIKLIGRYLL